MQNLILFMLLSSTTVDFLAKARLLPSLVTFIPEFIGAFTLLYVTAGSGKGLFQLVRPGYWFVLGAIALVMACGIVINGVEAGVIFVGIRNFLRAIPLLLLPAVIAFTEPEIRKQLRLIMFICFMQLPLTLYQKTLPNVSGDSIYGTFVISSHLSIFLICSACVLTGLYLRRKIGLWQYGLLLVLFLVPTTINETKGTLVLLPLGLVVAFILGAQRGARLKNTVIVAGVLATFGMAFAAIYDYTQKDVEYRPGIVEFFTEGTAEKYMQKDRGFTTDKKEIGRLDAVLTPLEYLKRDPITLAFGLGIGNASVSSLGIEFQGKYGDIFKPYMQHTAARLLLEIGLFGSGLVLILMFMLFRDAYLVSTSGGLHGAIAVGWMGVVALLTPAMFYKDIMAAAGITFPFWYFSGLIAAHRMRLGLRLWSAPEARRVPA